MLTVTWKVGERMILETSDGPVIIERLNHNQFGFTAGRLVDIYREAVFRKQFPHVLLPPPMKNGKGKRDG